MVASMPTPEADAQHIAAAQQLAINGRYLTDPNPRVGCILTDADGHVLGAGHTQRAGGPHAEIMALREAAAVADRLNGRRQRG